jgi:hypothetical protein
MSKVQVDPIFAAPGSCPRAAMALTVLASLPRIATASCMVTRSRGLSRPFGSFLVGAGACATRLGELGAGKGTTPI